MSKQPVNPLRPKSECPKCGSALSVQPDLTFCGSCGWRSDKQSVGNWKEDIERAKNYSRAQWESVESDIFESKRHADGSLNGPFPDELQRWNWGAFLFSWLWATAHNLWLFAIAGLALCFVPSGIGMIVMSVILGMFGNRMAWMTRKFSGKDEFIECQQTWEAWAALGGIVWLLWVGASVLWLVRGLLMHK